MIILAIDGLEYSLVEEFDCKNLKQKFYGKTDIKEFTEPRTMVLWSSFMTGKNMEKYILYENKIENKENKMWDTEINFADTFFHSFGNPKIIDLPGFNYNKEQHKIERDLLKNFFEEENYDKKDEIRSEYNNIAFEHYRNIKQEFETSLEDNYDFILGYFSVADVVGHLNFGNNIMMRMIYKDLDEIANKIKAKKIKNTYIVLSDHGMEKIGIYGDHSRYGFWSTNFKDLGNPKITDFSKIILNNKKNKT